MHITSSAPCSYFFLAVQDIHLNNFNSESPRESRSRNGNLWGTYQDRYSVYRAAFRAMGRAFFPERVPLSISRFPINVYARPPLVLKKGIFRLFQYHSILFFHSFAIYYHFQILFILFILYTYTQKNICTLNLKLK